MDDKRAAFNAQMNEWISHQGIWFQLRHAAEGQSLLSRLARFALRLCLIAAILAVGVGWYLFSRVEKDGFREDLQFALEATLRAEEGEMRAIKKERDTMVISSIKMEGAEDAFFHHLKARNIQVNRKLTDGLYGVWDGGGIMIDRLEVNLKAGGSDDVSAATAYQGLFVESKSFQFEWIEANHTSLTWGYSSSNKGSIEGSRMMAVRRDDEWMMEFRGGTLSQNWFHELGIIKMVVIANQEGVYIKEAQLSSGTGILSFQLNVGSGGQPPLSGTVTLDSFPVQSILPFRFREWITGDISGTGTISGSTNSQEGVVMDLNLSLAEGDVLVLRDSLPILSALTAVDVYNTYRKISFTEGGFHLSTRGAKVKFEQVDLKAGELFHLTGNLESRMPTYDEIAKTLEIKKVEDVKDLLEQHLMRQSESLEDESKMTVSGDFSNLKKKSVAVEKPQTFTKLELKKNSIIHESKIRRFEGVLNVGLKGDAFDKAPQLKLTYPLDEKTARIWIKVPMNGPLKTLTLKQAKQLYLLGRTRR